MGRGLCQQARMDVHLLSAPGWGKMGKAEHRLLKLLGHKTEAGRKDPRIGRLLSAPAGDCPSQGMYCKSMVAPGC